VLVVYEDQSQNVWLAQVLTLVIKNHALMVREIGPCLLQFGQTCLSFLGDSKQ